MFCCIHDPHLASLLAGNEDVMPDGRTELFVHGVLALQILCLVMIGGLTW